MSSSRERIVEAASRLVAERGAAGVTMAELARESGVSRQMVYLNFENRAGVLTAVTHHLDERGRVRERFAECLAMEPEQGLEATIRVWLDYLPTILPVARELYAAALAGADGGEAWDVRMDELRRLFSTAARRVRLREPWTADTAGDWIWSRCHLAAYDQLVVTRGWAAEDFVEQTVRATLSELLAHR